MNQFCLGTRRLRTLIKMMAAMRVIPQTRPRHGADVQPASRVTRMVKKIVLRLRDPATNRFVFKDSHRK